MSPPRASESSPPQPMWRPTGQGGTGASPRRLPGWIAKERRLRAKLAGPAGPADGTEEEGGPGAALPGDLHPIGEDEEAPRPPPPPRQEHVPPSRTRPHAYASEDAAQAWDESELSRVQPLRLVAPSRLFDDDAGTDRLPSPLRSAFPPSPTRGLPLARVVSGARTPIAVLRVASRRIIQPALGRSPTLAPLAAPTSHERLPFAAGADASAASSLVQDWDAPATRILTHDASGLSRYLPEGARGPAPSPSPHTRSTGHREWSQGLAWLYENTDGVDAVAVPVPELVLSPAQPLLQSVARQASFRVPALSPVSAISQVFEAPSRGTVQTDHAPSRPPKASAAVFPQVSPNVSESLEMP